MKRFAILSVLFLAACTDTDGAKRALEAQGFKDIQITGFQYFGCDQRDAFRTGFKATNVNGIPTIGVVCSGWLKGATVRFQ